MSPELVRVGYDVVDNEYFREHAAQARSQDRVQRQRLALPERYLLASSRFVPKKNVRNLLRGFAQYASESGADAWHLVLLGDGELRGAIERHAAELGVSRLLHLPGFIQYDELPIYYGLAEAFVHAAIVEPWGLVVNEAMASGLPVLISRQCGCAEDLVSEGRNGFLFDAERPGELAAVLRSLSVKEQVLKEMGKASGEIIQSWDLGRFADALWELARVACTHRRRRSLWDRMVAYAAASN
jgi:glycosyltransferase involved in cell wall biosynthesis